MVEIYIDQHRCEVEAGYKIDEKIFTFDADAFRDLDTARTGRSATVSLPLTPRNERIMGFASDPATATTFNSTLHRGRIAVDGVTLLEGVATLYAIEAEQGVGRYRVRISDGAGDWIETISSRTLAQAPIEYSATLDYQTIEQSWYGEKSVRFLPVRHDDYREPYSSQSLYAPQRVMSSSDYHPFISVRDMLLAIFRSAGYEVESRFLQSDLARKLYFSGRYSSAGGSATRLNNSSGFKAGRTSESTATADVMGRVWMSPLVLTSSVGNFVQTAQGGEFYNNRSVLQISDEGVEYRPQAEANIGFEIFLKYTTDYRMISSKRLQGFDALYVDTGCDLQIPLSNPYKDRRETATAGVQYKCIVFDHQAGTTLRLIYRRASAETAIATITTAETLITMPAVSGGSCLLLDSSGQEYKGDWALYDGYVQRTGTTEVEVTLQTPAELLSPSKRKSFTKMYLHGAAQGQRVTLSSLCTLRPLFSPSPAMGSALSWESILAHDASQREFVEAIQQMFNLRIATCEQQKRVYIEPYDDFYDGTIRDMSIYAQGKSPMRACDLALAVRHNRTLCYRAEGDGAVMRHNARNEEHFGEWNTSMPSYATTMGRERRANTLFCPTISSKGIHASAPSAYIMQVGDRDADNEAEISMRVVRYEGMRALPAGERWGAPSFGEEYPYAAFHSPGEFTLCFEDRDQEQGLHRYYDREYAAQARRRSLALSLNLPAHLLASLTEVQTGGGARNTYRLRVAGQRASYYLQKIEGYDVASGTAQCLFVRRAED